jgi:hypothetical protein
MAAGFRFLYYRFGEILTLLVTAGIGAYILVSLADSRRILENENRARSIVLEIHRCETASSNAPAGRYRPLDRLRQESRLLKGLTDVTPAERPHAELFVDGHYYYALLLEYPPKSAESYRAARGDDAPTAFRVMAWPVAFAVTGEAAYYIDQRGELARTANERAVLEGREAFPPDWHEPASAFEEKGNGPAGFPNPWRIDPPR